MLTGICHNKDVVLIDYRNNNQLTQQQGIDINTKIESLDELINIIKHSTSSLGIFSSGTEGIPKLIYQPIQRLLKSVVIDKSYLQSKWAFTYNPSHSAGVQVFLQALCNKAALYDLYKASREQTIFTLSTNKIQFISATPTFYRMLAPYNFKMESVQSATLNGEKSTRELIDNVKNIFPNARIRNIYGSTESGPLISSENAIFNVPDRLLGKIKIVDNELLLANALVSRSTNTQDWYRTGDLVEIKSNDPLSFEFVSRKSRIINVGGHNVNPQEVEEVLLTHPLVKDARSFGKPSSIIGNVVSAEVQVIDGHIISEKEIIDFCRSKLANYKVPRIVKFVNEIKSSHTGKKSL